MRLVTIKREYLKIYSPDKEMLHNKSGRPCVLIISAQYRGHYYDFAVPLRSNINASTPKELYFALPIRSTTRPGNRHGIHYSKMFPVDRKAAIRFRTENNASSVLMKRIIDSNERRIVSECQKYLLKYENGYRPKYCTNIDLLISLMNKRGNSPARG